MLRMPTALFEHLRFGRVRSRLQRRCWCRRWWPALSNRLSRQSRRGHHYGNNVFLLQVPKLVISFYTTHLWRGHMCKHSNVIWCGLIALATILASSLAGATTEMTTGGLVDSSCVQEVPNGATING